MKHMKDQVITCNYSNNNMKKNFDNFTFVILMLSNFYNSYIVSMHDRLMKSKI